MFELYSVDRDNVIDAAVGFGKTDYAYALEHFYAQINQLGIQRKLQDVKFYDRLKRDILNGCVMPPITIAFISPEVKDLQQFTVASIADFMKENIHSGFILDGIQRLNTLKRASEESGDAFPKNFPLFFSVLVCKTMDSLLYRMITLNNGQKPMTTRHQIEIITSNLYDFSDSPVSIETEKNNARKRGTFKQADFILAYLAFLSNSTAIDNQKLIEEKLDQLIAFKILESDPVETSMQFSDVLELIDELSKEPEVKSWFRNVNNLVGFSSAIRSGFKELNGESAEIFLKVHKEFELAFGSFSVSKIRLGQARRNAVNQFIGNYGVFRSLSHLEMMEKLAQHI